MDGKQKLEYDAVKPNKNDSLWIKSILRQLLMERKITLRELANLYVSVDGNRYGKLLEE